VLILIENISITNLKAQEFIFKVLVFGGRIVPQNVVKWGLATWE